MKDRIDTGCDVCDEDADAGGFDEEVHFVEHLLRIPDANVHERMRQACLRGLKLARKTSSPGDGMMSYLFDEVVGDGMHHGGWKLQVNIVEDRRMFEGPHVVVHAFQDDCDTKGSVLAKIVRSKEERRTLVVEQIRSMENEIIELQKDIYKLASRLDAEDY
jgi:hypothetical protein